MAIRGVESDAEQAIVNVIKARLITDGISAHVDGLTLGAPGQEPQMPYVFVMVRPAQHRGSAIGQWTADASIEIRTQHLDGRDRDGSMLTKLFESVAYACDFDNFTAQATRLYSINVRRTGGDYAFEESTNMVSISCELILCGS